MEAAAAGKCGPSRFADNEIYNQRNQPVIGVNWERAQDFARWKMMRLPKEDEWEYAARGPESWTWPWGNDFVADNLVYSENSAGCSSHVGSRPGGASWVGALDMSGNVWEWSASKWRDTYHKIEDNVANGSDDSVRVLRGGSWISDYYTTRCSVRNGPLPYSKFFYYGFRLVFDLAL
jgi:formylglycine-generating enzyme required for sulfatase activity